jgi:hypothetical protein
LWYRIHIYMFVVSRRFRVMYGLNSGLKKNKIICGLHRGNYVDSSLMGCCSVMLVDVSEERIASILVEGKIC